MAEKNGNSDGSEAGWEKVERYIAYFRNFKAVIRPSLRGIKLIHKNSRVLVHSAEVGDAFRPISLPSSIYFVANVISLSYVAIEVTRSFELAYTHTQNAMFASIIASKTFLFEVISSLALPALMIHGAVHTTEAITHKLFSYSPQPQLGTSLTGKQLLYVKYSQMARNFGPTTVGLACIPFLPTILDGPVERSLDQLYDKYFPEEMDRFHAIKAARKVSNFID